ncbi:MAG: long-chain fatty acid--CoA ligase [Actinobacteria bacterium]|nr:MAG: long-chain fatty acid--CoA ligase [Actinomycetota bacterium]
MKGSVRSVVDLMRDTAQAHPEREAFVDGGRRLTFAAWDRAADGLAATLAEAGVGRGDVVCLMLPSSADYAVCYQAAMRLGAITSGINPRLGPSEVSSIIARTRPKLTVLPTDREPPPGAGRLLTRDELEEACGRDPIRPRPRIDGSEAVAIVWTSGTTGEPKGAVFGHANLKACAVGAGDLSRPGDRRLSPLPFAHVGYMTKPWDELANVITTIIVPTPWKAGEALRLIEEEAVTVAQGVPTQWSLMLADPRFEATDVSSLRVAGTGASTVPPELVREMRRRLRCPVVVAYASTEAAITTRSRIGDPDEVVSGTVGRASEGVEVELADADADADADGTRGEVGRVRCRSAAVMLGYWGDPARTAEVLDADSWLTTGDLGRFDDAGNLVLVGRKSEMYIRGGYNVYPAEVEGVLGEHPGVDKVAVVGLPDPVLGQIGAAYVVPAPGATPQLDDLRAWCRRRLADYKAPDRLELLTELPLTSMLKVDKQALLRAPTPPSSASSGPRSRPAGSS